MLARLLVRSIAIPTAAARMARGSAALSSSKQMPKQQSICEKIMEADLRTDYIQAEIILEGLRDRISQGLVKDGFRLRWGYDNGSTIIYLGDYSTSVCRYHGRIHPEAIANYFKEMGLEVKQLGSYWDFILDIKAPASVQG